MIEKPKKCRHVNGWFSEAVVFLSAEHGARVFQNFLTNRVGKLRMRCNVHGCEAVRNIYFKGGQFVKVGRPFIPKPAARSGEQAP